MPSSPIPGLRPSPITAKSLATSLRLSDPCWDTDGQTVGWLEGRSDRGVLVVQRLDEASPRDLTTDISVRAFVGYGGGDFTLGHGHAFYVGQEDQRIYRQPLRHGPPHAVTPAFGAASTPTLSPDGRWLAYTHSYDGMDSVALVPADGSRWPIRIGEGRDFYMQPAWHPSGERIAWVEWDHPNMPWDGSELRVSSLRFPDAGVPTVDQSHVVAGGEATAIFQPLFSPDGQSLYYVSDESGWGHIHRINLGDGSVVALTGGELEHAIPAWAQGMHTMSVDGDGTLYAVRGEQNVNTLITIDGAGALGDLRDVHFGYDSLAAPAASPVEPKVALVGSSGNQSPRVLLFDLAARGCRSSVLRRATGETVASHELAEARPTSWKSFDGEDAHGILFLPPGETPEDAPLPPVIVLVHGGPTSAALPAWNPQAQYFATRGYVVLLVNYRGSTGYGRAYMEKLRGNWGIYDVKDAEFGVRALAERGLADDGKAVIFGGSAGGFTVFQSLVELPGFYKAGICMFGVSNMFTLAADTHKFESRYLDSLLGPLPESAAVYRKRSPIFHADSIVDPVAVFQGDIDRVVPREQSDSIVASLKARGVPHEYHVYEGEGHGWRKTETVEHFYGAVGRFLRERVIFA